MWQYRFTCFLQTLGRLPDRHLDLALMPRGPEPGLRLGSPLYYFELHQLVLRLEWQLRYCYQCNLGSIDHMFLRLHPFTRYLSEYYLQLGQDPKVQFANFLAAQ